MPFRSAALQYRRYRAPHDDRQVLVEPPFSELDGLLAENVRLHAQASYDFQGRGLTQLAAQARNELLAAARRWTAAYRPDAVAAGSRPGPIFLAGHQPEMFHPGVWLKNFVLGALARQYGGTAVNLVIDSDTAKNTALRTPGGSIAQPNVEMIPFDRPEPRLPYEERRVVDRRQFEDFGRRVTQRMAALAPDLLLRQFWPMVLQRLQQSDHLGTCLAQARHQLEGRWGLQTLEVPQSWVCQTESFAWLIVHLLAQLPRFHQCYNQAVEEYRRVHKIRNEAQPVPNLAADGPWLEAPLWLWTADRPLRRRVFARAQDAEVLLTDGEGLEVRLAVSPESDGARAVGQLAELRSRGIKIRSRALITTLWARLVLGDLFLHGIGGAKYDQVTDLLMERFFALPPPGILVLSATLHLPIARPPLESDPAGGIAQQLRELTYHPERFLQSSADAPAEAESLREAKNRWIRTPATAENAYARRQAIRQSNEALQPWVAQRRRQLLERQAASARARRVESIFAWREYAFCLYPEKTLREFFEGVTSQGRGNML
jgi:hypothetical protein